MTLKEGKLNRAVVLDEQQAKAIREWLNAHNKSLIADVSLIMQAAVLRVGDAVGSSILSPPITFIYTSYPPKL